MMIIAVAGGSGSGKSTFVKKVQKHVNNSDVIHLSLDSYYLPKITELINNSPNYDHPDAFDWSLLIDHFEKLQEGKPIQTPVYDFKTNSRTNETQQISNAKVILFEGLFTLYHPEIRRLCEIKTFISVDADIRFARRLGRDINERGRSVESVIEQYYKTVRPMHSRYLEPQKKYADFIVGEESDKASEILASAIREKL